jgi:hypothetical protein
MLSMKRLVVTLIVVVLAGTTPVYSQHPNGCMASTATQKWCVYRSRGPGSYRAAGTSITYLYPNGASWGVRISHDDGRTWTNARFDYEPSVWTGSIPSQRGDFVWIFIADVSNGIIEAHDDE